MRKGPGPKSEGGKEEGERGEGSTGKKWFEEGPQGPRKNYMNNKNKLNT